MKQLGRVKNETTTFYFSITTWLRIRPGATRLVDKCQVGTPIHQSLVANSHFYSSALSDATFKNTFL